MAEPCALQQVLDLHEVILSRMAAVTDREILRCAAG
jgi:hypothetical protein